MAIDWANLLQQRVKAVAARRPNGGESGPMVDQVMADMNTIVDIHHRKHHKDWLTVVDDSGRMSCARTSSDAGRCRSPSPGHKPE